jgi:hypothetical protein
MPTSDETSAAERLGHKGGEVEHKSLGGMGSGAHGMFPQQGRGQADPFSSWP